MIISKVRRQNIVSFLKNFSEIAKALEANIEGNFGYTSCILTEQSSRFF